jgi:DNA-binding transcriptional ArsR family regulator
MSVSKREPQEQPDAYELVFTALAHPARRRILMTVYLQGGTMTAGEVADLFKEAWPTTTRHLQVLESAGLLQHERKGRQRLYRIDRRRLDLVRNWLAWFSKDPK